MKQPTQTSRNEQRTAPATRSVRDLAVLVVDDEPDVAFYLASVLEDAGFTVATASNGDEAMERIRRRPPDLISLDLVMPGKSGVRLLAELRRDRELRRIPVVIVSGHAHEPGIRRDLDEVLAESALVGPSHCLDKPVTPEKYLRHVCELLHVEPSSPGAEEGADDALRRRAMDLLGTADPDTLKVVLAQLERRQS